MNAHRLINGLIFECLEPRQMLSVSLDSNGWYNVTPSADTRIIYVSSSTGLDTNDGLSAATPVLTLNKAKSLLRDGSPDWLLLKRGDTFTGGFGGWTRSGRSADEPMVIGAYGDGDRPLLNTGISEGVLTLGGNPVNNLAILGLHFYADGYNGNNGDFQTAGLRFLRQGSNYLIQDVKVEGYKDNIVLQGDGTGLTNVEINRVISVDAYANGTVGNGHAQGLYAWEFTNGLTIERSVFDHNGWKEGVAVATVFNHDLYINTGAQNVVVRNNIISRASNNGLLLRAGGTVQNNLFVRNSVGAIVDHTASTITGNVVLESVPVPSQPQGVGFNIETVPSAQVSNNIVAHDTNSGSNVIGIAINGGAGNVVVENNTFYDWRDEVNNGGNRKITIRDNAVQHLASGTSPIMENRGVVNTSTYFYSGNIYYSPRSRPFRINGADKSYSDWVAATLEKNSQFQQLNYVDPNRSVGSYYATLGGTATTDAFLAAARNQPTNAWDETLGAAPVIQYIRAGFAGASASGVIQGTVYNDAAGNGVRDGSDAAVSGATVYIDDNNDGKKQGNELSTTTNSSGGYTFANLADGTYIVRVVVPNGMQQTAPPNDGAITIQIGGGATYTGRDFGVWVPITLASGSFDPSTSQLITISFNADVYASLDQSDLQVVNVQTGTPVDMGLFTFSKSASGAPTVAMWSSKTLPDGNYKATLPANSVTSSYGPLQTDCTITFFVLAADGNRDGRVDILDFNLLAVNFGKTATFLQGNYDYSSDGLIDIGDFNVLALNFGDTVATTSASATSASTSNSDQATSSIGGSSNAATPSVARVDDQLVQDVLA